MIKQINQVREFHEKFGIPVANQVTFSDLDIDILDLRINLIQEESEEVEKAIYLEGIDDVAKELCDLLYVTYGTILTLGLQDKIEECFNEVHRSNMSKLGKDGKPIYRQDGKLLKGENYSQADIASILNKNA